MCPAPGLVFEDREVMDVECLRRREKAVTDGVAIAPPVVARRGRATAPVVSRKGRVRRGWTSRAPCLGRGRRLNMWVVFPSMGADHWARGRAVGVLWELRGGGARGLVSPRCGPYGWERDGVV